MDEKDCRKENNDYELWINLRKIRTQPVQTYS